MDTLVHVKFQDSSNNKSIEGKLHVKFQDISTGSHLLITGEVSPIPISVWGGCWFKCGWSMAKNQQHEICSTQNWTGNAQGSEGHINFSQ
jgi:hypothetical protein